MKTPRQNQATIIAHEERPLSEGVLQILEKARELVVDLRTPKGNLRWKRYPHRAFKLVQLHQKSGLGVEEFARLVGIATTFRHFQYGHGTDGQWWSELRCLLRGEELPECPDYEGAEPKGSDPEVLGPRLTQRKQEVLAALSKGDSQAEVSKKLGISRQRVSLISKQHPHPSLEAKRIRSNVIRARDEAILAFKGTQAAAARAFGLSPVAVCMIWKRSGLREVDPTKDSQVENEIRQVLSNIRGPSGNLEWKNHPSETAELVRLFRQSGFSKYRLERMGCSSQVLTSLCEGRTSGGLPWPALEQLLLHPEEGNVGKVSNSLVVEPRRYPKTRKLAGHPRKPRTVITEELREQVLSLLQKGLNHEVIADEVDVSITTIFRLAKRAGMISPRSTYSSELWDKVLQLRRDGKTYVEIAKLCGISYPTLFAWIKKAGPLDPRED